MRHFFLIVALGEIFYGIVLGQSTFYETLNPNGGHFPPGAPDEDVDLKEFEGGIQLSYFQDDNLLKLGEETQFEYTFEEYPDKNQDILPSTNNPDQIEDANNFVQFNFPISTSSDREKSPVPSSNNKLSRKKRAGGWGGWGNWGAKPETTTTTTTRQPFIPQNQANNQRPRLRNGPNGRRRRKGPRRPENFPGRQNFNPQNGNTNPSNFGQNAPFPNVPNEYPGIPKNFVNDMLSGLNSNLPALQTSTPQPPPTVPPGIPNDFPKFSYPPGFFKDMLSGLNNPLPTVAPIEDSNKEINTPEPPAPVPLRIPNDFPNVSYPKGFFSDMLSGLNSTLPPIESPEDSNNAAPLNPEANGPGPFGRRRRPFGGGRPLRRRPGSGRPRRRRPKFPQNPVTDGIPVTQTTEPYNDFSTLGPETYPVTKTDSISTIPPTDIETTEIIEKDSSEYDTIDNSDTDENDSSEEDNDYSLIYPNTNYSMIAGPQTFSQPREIYETLMTPDMNKTKNVYKNNKHHPRHNTTMYRRRGKHHPHRNRYGIKHRRRPFGNRMRDGNDTVNYRPQIKRRRKKMHKKYPMEYETNYNSKNLSENPDWYNFDEPDDDADQSMGFNNTYNNLLSFLKPGSSLRTPSPLSSSEKPESYDFDKIDKDYGQIIGSAREPDDGDNNSRPKPDELLKASNDDSNENYRHRDKDQSMGFNNTYNNLLSFLKSAFGSSLTTPSPLYSSQKPESYDFDKTDKDYSQIIGSAREPNDSDNNSKPKPDELLKASNDNHSDDGTDQSTGFDSTYNKLLSFLKSAFGSSATTSSPPTSTLEEISGVYDEADDGIDETSKQFETTMKWGLGMQTSTEMTSYHTPSSSLELPTITQTEFITTDASTISLARTTVPENTLQTSNIPAMFESQQTTTLSFLDSADIPSPSGESDGGDNSTNSLLNFLKNLFGGLRNNSHNSSSPDINETIDEINDEERSKNRTDIPSPSIESDDGDNSTSSLLNYFKNLFGGLRRNSYNSSSPDINEAIDEIIDEERSKNRTVLRRKNNFPKRRKMRRRKKGHLHKRPNNMNLPTESTDDSFNEPDFSSFDKYLSNKLSEFRPKDSSSSITELINTEEPYTSTLLITQSSDIDTQKSTTELQLTQSELTIIPSTPMLVPSSTEISSTSEKTFSTFPEKIYTTPEAYTEMPSTSTLMPTISTMKPSSSSQIPSTSTSMSTETLISTPVEILSTTTIETPSTSTEGMPSTTTEIESTVTEMPVTTMTVLTTSTMLPSSTETISSSTGIFSTSMKPTETSLAPIETTESAKSSAVITSESTEIPSTSPEMLSTPTKLPETTTSPVETSTGTETLSTAVTSESTDIPSTTPEMIAAVTPSSPTEISPSTQVPSTIPEMISQSETPSTETPITSTQISLTSQSEQTSLKTELTSTEIPITTTPISLTSQSEQTSSETELTSTETPITSTQISLTSQSEQTSLETELTSTEIYITTTQMYLTSQSEQTSSKTELTSTESLSTSEASSFSTQPILSSTAEITTASEIHLSSTESLTIPPATDASLTSTENPLSSTEVPASSTELLIETTSAEPISTETLLSSSQTTVSPTILLSTTESSPTLTESIQTSSEKSSTSAVSDESLMDLTTSTTVSESITPDHQTSTAFESITTETMADLTSSVHDAATTEMASTKEENDAQKLTTAGLVSTNGEITEMPKVSGNSTSDMDEDEGENFPVTAIPPPGVKCKVNETYYSCVPHCQHTCFNFDSDVPCLPNFCEPGCFCSPGLVIDENGNCVDVKDCFQQACGIDEEWWDCKPECHNTCENYARAEACEDTVCNEGCFCREGYIRDVDGSCVDPEECAEPVCLDHEEETDCMSPCNRCTANCHSCKFFMCRSGCDCRDGYKRDDKGVCIQAALCPKCDVPENTASANATLGSASASSASASANSDSANSASASAASASSNSDSANAASASANSATVN
ncbi:serine-rich adhesin for platelets isoform X2 [Parasteatoda tepidariorum]|uniref:serine-rich adhesin for platelets isoform X2 n=1 Tax=Parasteatoda tepidariorum TaxID=114398 RepID=UPI0039BC3033